MKWDVGKEIFISDCNFTAEGDAATANEQYVDDDNANEQYGDDDNANEQYWDTDTANEQYGNDDGISRGRRGRERGKDPYGIEFCIIENRV